MLFSLVATLFAVFGLSASAALETLQLSVWEPGRKSRFFPLSPAPPLASPKDKLANEIHPPP